ncbi:isocitrate lyase/PEP mutase family protein [Erythrobacter sp. HA6-11]
MSKTQKPSGGAQLRALLASEDIVAAPGIYDHMSLLLGQAAGHKALYASGYWGTASAYGEADVGIAGMSDFVSTFGRFAARAEVPIIADADTGFGSLTNLRRAVQLYCQAGIAAMQIEDQPFPKICGHVGRATSVPAQEMVKRIRVAVETRGDDDLMVIARTDARRSEGLQAAIDRLSEYGEAGADILFLEAPESEEEIATAAAALDKPLLINAAHGGFTPILSPSGYAKLGAKLVIYPAGPSLSALQGAANFYASLARDDANPAHENMFDFKEISRLLGMEEIVAFQDRHGGA